MKVLLLTPKNPPNYTDALYLALRAQVGTCDYFPLDERQSNNLEDFFRRYIRLAHFDRILLMYSGQFIYQQSPFLRRLPTVAVLSLSQKQPSGAEQKKMLSNLKTMPWMRWIGTNPLFCREYQSLGFDAQWIPPSFNSAIYNAQNEPRMRSHCHIYAEEANRNELLMRLAQFNLTLHCYDPADDVEALAGHIMPEDIFIHWCNDSADIEALIRAQACGAVVLIQDMSIDDRVLYGFQTEENLIFPHELARVSDRVAQLLNQRELRAQISRGAVEKAKAFAPATVGKRIGRHIEATVRNPKNYSMKQRIFGFDI